MYAEDLLIGIYLEQMDVWNGSDCEDDLWAFLLLV